MRIIARSVLVKWNHKIVAIANPAPKMTIMKRIKAQSMKIWSWTVDDWNTAFQVLTVVFVAGTVVTGLGTVLTDRVVRKRQAEELATTKANTIKLPNTRDIDFCTSMDALSFRVA